MVGDLTAVFSGGRSVRLAGATVLFAPILPEDIVPVAPDVMAIILRARGAFPVRPVPCVLGAVCGGDVAGVGEYKLLHHPTP